MDWREEVRFIWEAAARAFGATLAEEIVTRLVRAADCSAQCAQAPQSISKLAIRDYLSESFFGSLAAPQVEAWVADQLKRANPERVQLLLSVAGRASNGSADDVMRQLVRLLA